MQLVCPNAVLACQAKRGKNKKEKKKKTKEPPKGALFERGACLGKVPRLCPGLGCGTCQFFFHLRFQSHSRLSNFPALCFSCLFSTPLRDAYIAHQPCDLEPPLYQCIVRLAKSMQKLLPGHFQRGHANIYLFVFVATTNGQVCLEKGEGGPCHGQKDVDK